MRIIQMKTFAILVASIGALAVVAVAVMMGLVLKNSKASGDFDSAVWDGTRDDLYFIRAEQQDSSIGLSESNPFIIDTAEKLAMLTHTNIEPNFSANKYFKQTKNIILNLGYENYENWGTEAPKNTWTPIGTSSDRFRGNYDGGGFEVRGLYINNPSGDEIGLFGAGQQCTIKNLGVTNSYINGKNYVGGIIGYIDNWMYEESYGGGVINCYNSSTTISGAVCVAGIAGEATDTDVVNCYNRGSITGSYNIGGIVGSLGYKTTKNCYNSGVISGDYYSTGAIAGYLNFGRMERCYWLDGTAQHMAYSNEGYAVEGITFNTQGQLSSSSLDTFDLKDALNNWRESSSGGNGSDNYATWIGTSAVPYPQFNFNSSNGEPEPEPVDECLCPCVMCVKERNS